MNQKKLLRTLFALITLGILLAVKIIFFEGSSTQQTIVSILNWIIYLFSIAILIYHVITNQEKIKIYINQYKDKLVIFLAIFVLEVVFVMKNQLPFSRVYIFSIIFALSVYVLISLFLSKKISRILDIFVLIFIGIYMIGQDTYYRIFNDLFSFKEARSIQEGLESGQSMYQLNWLHVLIVLIITAATYFYIKHTEASHLKMNRTLILKSLTIPLLLLTLIQLNADYSVQENRPYTSDHYLYRRLFNRTRFASKFGISQLIVLDFTDSMLPAFATTSDVEYIENYLSTNMKTHDLNDYSNLFKGKNLVFILAESYDEIALSEALTPNIYKLKTEGIDFQNHYTPVFPRTTSDTEFIFNTSLVPSIEDGPTTSTYTNNSYRTSLASLFNSNGYTTNAFHGNYKEFYDRHIIYDGYGYDEFYGQDELGLSDENKMFDSIFYNEASDLILPDTNPFYSFVISFAGHSPYDSKHPVADDHYDRVNTYYGMHVPDSIKYYIATQIEVDKMVGLLFDDLEEKNMLDDTVIIFSGDHYPYTLNQKDYTNYTNIEFDYEKHQGNLYIWSNDITPQTITQLSSSFDVLPMINNMFDLNGDYTNYVGNDIFDTNTSMVLFKDYTVFDGEIYLNLADRHFNHLALIQQSTQYYQFSRCVLRTNYYQTP